ncbi:MAG: DUF5686 family protein [Bacteroidia bacterium]
MKFYYSIVFILLATSLFAQSTRVKGCILNKDSKEPIVDANIYFKNSTVVDHSDKNGRYTIQALKKRDSIVIVALGYQTLQLFIKRHKSQRLNIELTPDKSTLDSAVLKLNNNPALRVLDSIIFHKKDNNADLYKNYRWEKYDKFEIYFGGYSNKLKDVKQFKKYKYIFKYVDTVNNKPLLPIYMSESIFEKCLSQRGSINEEKLIAKKNTGSNYENITTTVNKLIENINIYDNYFQLLDKPFISPISTNYILFYNYQLIENISINNIHYYKIRFEPKWKEDFAFSGIMYVNDSTWGIKKIEMKITNDINLNYVRDFNINLEYELINRKWVPKEYEINAILSALKWRNSENFIVNRYTSYKDISLSSNEQLDTACKSIKEYDNDNIEIKTEDFWRKRRHKKLDGKEKYNYLVAETVNYVPLIEKFKNICNIIIPGYMELGKVSLYQFTTFYSSNKIEGNRLKFGLITNKYFSKKIQLQAYIAYGTGDKKIKYNTSVLYVVNKSVNRLLFGVGYKYDLTQLGVSPNHIAIDNFTNSFSKINNKTKLTFNTEANCWIEKEWTKGVVSKITLKNATIKPLGSLSFQKILEQPTPSIKSLDHLTFSEIEFSNRFSIKEKYYINEFKRNSLGSKYPIFIIDVTLGGKDILNSDYNYQKLKLILKGKFNLNPFGYTAYHFEAGNIFGVVPYPFLFLHPANQTLAYDTEGFNLMNYFEFASDQYIQLYLDHHFDGFFFNKIPVVKKAQLREVISVKSVMGTIKTKNKNELILPTEMKEPISPYVECSVGIENIFKLLRIDYVWRVTQRLPSPSKNWGIKARLYFSF